MASKMMGYKKFKVYKKPGYGLRATHVKGSKLLTTVIAKTYEEAEVVAMHYYYSLTKVPKLVLPSHVIDLSEGSKTEVDVQDHLGYRRVAE